MGRTNQFRTAGKLLETSTLPAGTLRTVDVVVEALQGEGRRAWIDKTLRHHLVQELEQRNVTYRDVGLAPPIHDRVLVKGPWKRSAAHASVCIEDTTGRRRLYSLVPPPPLRAPQAPLPPPSAAPNPPPPPDHQTLPPPPENISLGRRPQKHRLRRGRVMQGTHSLRMRHRPRVLARV
jgi:hypothetical protein